jgi:hypothetical protein
MQNQIMAYWQQFLQFEFSNEVLMICGAMLVLIGVMRIIRSSLRLVFWVFLSGIGVAAVSYGMTGSAIDLPGTNGNLTDLVGQGKDIPIDALRVLCLKLEDQ